MNDARVGAEINMEHLQGARMGLDIDDFEYLLNGTLFSSLTAIWGCECNVYRRYERRSVEISIACPALLAAGIEQKLEHIFSNPQDRAVYEVDSYPQNHRLNVNRIVSERMRNAGGPMTAPPIYGEQAISPPVDYSHSAYAQASATMDTVVPDAPGTKVKHIEIPKPEQKRIVKLDIK